MTRLEVGITYEAIGPAHGSKLGPPARVEVLQVDETAGLYRVKGTRLPAEVILFGCEHFWQPVSALELLPPAPAWHDGRLVAFDLETTAPEPTEARIVTAAIAVVGGGQKTETLTLLADPGVEIPAEAAAIHGITTEQARADGQPARDVVAQVLGALTKHLANGWPLVIFNARYDLTVLGREARRYGQVPLTKRLAVRGLSLLVIDPLVIDKHLHRYRKGSRKLDAQAEHYGAKLDQAHDAAADAIAAARVAWCIGKRGTIIRRAGSLEQRQLDIEWQQVRDDLPALHAAQQRWALAERDRIAEYRRGQGDPEWEKIAGERGWPVIELEQAVAA